MFSFHWMRISDLKFLRQGWLWGQDFLNTKQGSKLKKMSGRKFATSYQNLVATLKVLVAKLIEAI